MPRIVDVDVTRHNPGDIVFQGDSTNIIPNSLDCDGSIQLQSAYPLLYAKIGSTYNIGVVPGGSFMLPDMRGRTPICQGAGVGLTARTIGTIPSSEETHVISESEMPTHNHASSSLDVAGTHNHTYAGPWVDVADTEIDFTSPFEPTSVYFFNSSVADTTASNQSLINHIHGISSISGAGGGLSHDNMAPSLVSHFVIVYA